MRAILHVEAEKDIEEAAAFYEREGSPVLAAKFVSEVKRVIALLTQNPGSEHRGTFPLVEGRSLLDVSLGLYMKNCPHPGKRASSRANACSIGTVAALAAPARDSLSSATASQAASIS